MVMMLWCTFRHPRVGGNPYTEYLATVVGKYYSAILTPKAKPSLYLPSLQLT